MNCKLLIIVRLVDVYACDELRHNMPPRRDPNPKNILRDLAHAIETLTARLDGQAVV